MCQYATAKKPFTSGTSGLGSSGSRAQYLGGKKRWLRSWSGECEKELNMHENMLGFWALFGDESSPGS